MGHHTGAIDVTTRTVEAMSVRPTVRVPPVAAAAAALIALQLAVRSVLAFGGYFYWDDLILVGRAGTQPLLSASYLFTDHDGHVMPAAFLLGGAVVTETMFSWPGVGRLAVGAIVSSDFPTAQGAIMILAIAFLSINLIVDVLYVYLDPRMQRS